MKIDDDGNCTFDSDLELSLFIIWLNETIKSKLECELLAAMDRGEDDSKD